MTTFLDELREGLAKPQKSVPPTWFYDERGSALFEDITRLDEYYPTETERRILLDHASEIVDAVGLPVCLAELGAGSAYKTRVLIDELVRRDGIAGFSAIDISEEAIRLARETIETAFPSVLFHGITARNRAGIQELDWGADHHHLVLFLGSSIGNFEPEQAAEWLRDITEPLLAGDYFLLGVDRVKDTHIIERAYDDSTGVTAAFNLNVLARANRELGANFDISTFEHVALFNTEQSRIEMHLRSTRAQSVQIPGIGDVLFVEGETIHTENSYKYSEEMLSTLLKRAGLREVRRWEDGNRWFNLLLLERAGLSRPE